MTKATWGEGDVVSIPVDGVGDAVGVIARLTGRGMQMLGYFFLPTKAEQLTDFSQLRAIDADLVARASALYLKQGRWKVVGAVESWDPNEWPIPVFEFIEPLRGLVFHRIYDEGELDQLPRQVRVEASTPGMPGDGLYGSGAVERHLSRLTGVEPPKL